MIRRHCQGWRGVRAFGLLLLLAAFAAGCKDKTDHPPIQSRRVAEKGEQRLMLYVPCSIFGPFCTPLDAYMAANPKVQVEFDSGNSVVLKRQVLAKGERPDLYIGTGPLEIEPLIAAGLIEEGSLRQVSTDTIILVVPHANPANIRSAQDLAEPRVTFIAMPDPKENSSGQAAVEAFQKLGLWEKIKDKVQYTEFGRTSRRYAMEGKVQAVVMYRSCLYEELKPGEAIAAPKEIAVVADLLALAGMPEIPTRGGVLKASKQKELAAAFLDTLTKEPAQEVFEKWHVITGAVLQSSPRPAAMPAANAKVLVQAFFPFNEEHQFIADYVKSLPAKFGPEVAVQVVDFRKPDGYKTWRATGLTCGGVLLNGKCEADVVIAGQPRKAQFLRRPGVGWEKEELEAAIRDLLAASPADKAAAAPAAEKK